MRCLLIAALGVSAGFVMSSHGRIGAREASSGCCGIPSLESAAPGAAWPASPERARAVFERLKKLEGKWRGKSTKGWTDTGEYRAIAGGSVVMHTEFDAHPGETMATMYHMDGDRLLLTHYCVARNQPRLVASEISEDLSTVKFTFLDATNLASRDKGHMDSCIVKFIDDRSFTSKWTWYQDGKESWMEEIVCERAVDSGPAAGGDGAKSEPMKP